MIKAVVFDLDDTLYSETDYVKSGFVAVGDELKRRYGIANASTELLSMFEQNRVGVLDRYAELHGMTESEAKELVEVYRGHDPVLSLAKDVTTTLVNLRLSGMKLGIITDGRPVGQRKKIAALGLDSMVDKIVITDELGGVEFRKPNPKAFELMCEKLGVSPEHMLYVGDNPRKDFAVKKFLPVKTIALIRSGLYENEDYAYGILPDLRIRALSETEDLSRKL